MGSFGSARRSRISARSATRSWPPTASTRATQAGGARVQAIYRDLTLTGAFSVTGAGNTVQNPWGSSPGYPSMIDAHEVVVFGPES